MAILQLVGGLLLLIAGGEVLVRGAVALATRFGLSPLVIGLTIVSFGTSAPELLVSLNAALNGDPAIALGNVAGSNIANLGLVLGLTALIRPVSPERSSWRVHWPVMMIATLVVVIMLLNDSFGRVDGIICLLLLAGYLGWMFMSRDPSAGVEMDARMRPLVILLFIVGGIVGLAFGAEWFVDGASTMASSFGVSEQMIGLTVVAFGTSVPELVTSLIAALRGSSDISIGNLIGSNIFNLFAILGITGLVEPLLISFADFQFDLIVMCLFALLLYPLMRITGSVGRWQGAVLLLSYIAYIAYVVVRG